MWSQYTRSLFCSSLSPSSFKIVSIGRISLRNPSVAYNCLNGYRTQQVARNSFLRRDRRSIRNFDPSNIQSSSDSSLKLLIRPTIFTIGFVGSSFIGCAVWQYESHRSKLKRAKERWLGKAKSNEFSQQLKNIWKDFNEGQRLIGSIIGLNFIVFLLWRVKRFEGFLLKYFTSTPFKRNLSPMILSTFSHYNGVHFLCNMYVLWSFSDPIIRIFGKEQFLAVFLSGGVVSSWFSYVFKLLTRTPNISLGASGSIMALIGAVCSQYPDAKLSIIFLPFFTFSARSALIGMITFDLVGTLFRWRFLDHSAHLGGVLFGIFYVKYGYQYLWESLKPLVESWHRFREKFR